MGQTSETPDFHALISALQQESYAAGKRRGPPQPSETYEPLMREIRTLERELANAHREREEARERAERAEKDAGRWRACDYLSTEGIRYSEGEWGVELRGIPGQLPGGGLFTAHTLDAAMDEAVAALVAKGDTHE